MANIGIAPPPPPKFLKEQKEESKKEEKPVFNQEKMASDESKKGGFFNRVFGGNKSPKLSEDEIDIEKLRQEFKIPNKNDFVEEVKKPKPVISIDNWTEHPEDKALEVPEPKAIKASKSNSIVNWTGADAVVDKPAKSKVVSKWDSDTHNHLISKPVTKKASVKVKKIPKVVKTSIKSKKVVKKTSGSVKKKVVVKKAAPIIKKAKPAIKKPVAKIKASKKVDSIIEEYFKSVEKEQKVIQKELDDLVVHPKKSLKKSSNDYIIHHNEKLIKSMKELLAAINSIEAEKFNSNVQSNKKEFQKWVRGILDNEKKAEQQRNIILKQKIKAVLKEYHDGINKDIQDKKYELDALKKQADKESKNADLYNKQLGKTDLKLKNFEKTLKQNEKDFNKLMEQKIQSVIEKRLKKEHLAMVKATNKADKMFNDFAEKSEKLIAEKEDFNKHKEEAMQLLDEADALKKTKIYLERKDSKLKIDVDNLKQQQAELKKTNSALEKKDKDLLNKEKQLESQIKKLEARDAALLDQERQLKLELKDFDIRKKEVELRQKEALEMEMHVAKERHDLHEIKHNLMFREKEADEKLEEAKEIVHEVELEEIQFMEKQKVLEERNFQGYLNAKYEDVTTESPELSEEVRYLYDIVDNCRQLVESKQLDDAKKLYSEVKDKFVTANLKSDDKQMLYNVIRELYDDIYLAILSFQ